MTAVNSSDLNTSTMPDVKKSTAHYIFCANDFLDLNEQSFYSAIMLKQFLVNLILAKLKEVKIKIRLCFVRKNKFERYIG